MDEYDSTPFLLQIYPNVLAQCVYSAYIHAFPTSWNSFDDDFKTGLCDFISMWFKGLVRIISNLNGFHNKYGRNEIPTRGLEDMEHICT